MFHCLVDQYETAKNALWISTSIDLIARSKFERKIFRVDPDSRSRDYRLVEKWGWLDYNTV